MGLGDGLQPQAKAVAYAHGQGQDGGSAGQNLKQGQCGLRCGRVLHGLEYSHLQALGPCTRPNRDTLATSGAIGYLDLYTVK
jgi:hypothetical protein